MPQLDIILNLVWYICSIVGISVLYLQNVYVYLPLFIRYWKFTNYYIAYLHIFSIHICRIYLKFVNTKNYYTNSCTVIPYGLLPHLDIVARSSYTLDVNKYHIRGIFMNN